MIDLAFSYFKHFLNIYICLLPALSYAKLDDVLKDKYGSNYIMGFSKMYICICSVFLCARQLFYKIFMNFYIVLLIFNIVLTRYTSIEH